MTSDQEDRRIEEARTRSASSVTTILPIVRVPALTLIWHPEVSRVGERAWLTDLEEGLPVSLSRLVPKFEAPTGGTPRPLAETTVSRQPLRLLPDGDGLRLVLQAYSQPVQVDGVRVDDERRISAAELTRGVVLQLGARVVLGLQRHAPESTRPPAYDLVGESPGMVTLRRQIETVADLDAHVLIRGESGTGKELVARAIQNHSGRRAGPFQTVNMAAIPPSLAAAELFGAAKGAFSGADRSRPGYFRQTDGGTLFLDEIGETPQEVQVLLLRALESGEVQPVGAGRMHRVDVRILAATDADLDERVEAGSFALALLQRLRGFEIWIPPLRDRLEDFGRLFVHFLRAELEDLGRQDTLDYAGPLAHPFVSGHIVARMAAYDWPGNVRELRNEVRQLVIASRRLDRLAGGRWLEAPPSAPSSARQTARRRSSERRADRPEEPPASSSRPDPAGYRDPSDLTDPELLKTLAAEDWNIKATAEALGISRGSLYARIRNHPEVRKAIDLDAEEIEAALNRSNGRLEEAARFLRVSKQGLKRQISRLERSRRS